MVGDFGCWVSDSGLGLRVCDQGVGTEILAGSMPQVPLEAPSFLVRNVGRDPYI